MKTTFLLLLTGGTFCLAQGQIITYTGSPTYTTNQVNPTIPKRDSIKNPDNNWDKSIINQDVIIDKQDSKNRNRRDSLQKRMKTDSLKTRSH
jgi:hypothetical protein